MRTPEGSRVQPRTVTAVLAHLDINGGKGIFWRLRKTDEALQRFLSEAPVYLEDGASGPDIALRRRRPHVRIVSGAPLRNTVSPPNVADFPTPPQAAIAMTERELNAVSP